MSFSIGLRDLVNPWKRLAVGVLLIVFAIFCIVGKKWYIDVDKEDCVSITATFHDWKYHSGSDGMDVNRINLRFDDYASDVEIHSSCLSKELSDCVTNLKSGTKMELMVYEKTLTAYEIKVDGTSWLAFDDACKMIENNYKIISYVAYVLLPVGIILVISCIVSLFLLKKKEIDTL